MPSESYAACGAPDNKEGGAHHRPLKRKDLEDRVAGTGTRPNPEIRGRDAHDNEGAPACPCTCPTAATRRPRRGLDRVAVEGGGGAHVRRGEAFGAEEIPGDERAVDGAEQRKRHHRAKLRTRPCTRAKWPPSAGFVDDWYVPHGGKRWQVAAAYRCGWAHQRHRRPPPRRRRRARRDLDAAEEREDGRRDDPACAVVLQRARAGRRGCYTQLALEGAPARRLPAFPVRRVRREPVAADERRRHA